MYVSSIVIYVMPKNNAFVYQFCLLLLLCIPVLSSLDSGKAREAVPTARFFGFNGSTYSIPETKVTLIVQKILISLIDYIFMTF